MNRTYFLVAVGLMCHTALLAHTQPGATAPLWPLRDQSESLFAQQVQELAGGRGGGGIISLPLPRMETGKPFSATVTSQTSQTFVDGIHVSKTTTMVEYRDAEGRVRTETSQPDWSSSEQMKVITIRDPVAGVSYRLDPAKKSAVKLALAGIPITAAEGGGRGGRGSSVPQTPVQTLDELRAIQAAQTAIQAAQTAIQAAQTAFEAATNDIVEDLGTMTINGVPARGTRITTVVPAGAIGNDREFRSVSERWFSSDLDLLVKSVSTDPRFGTTTYELTNISRLPPDPSLFHVPVDYTVVSK